MVLCQTALGSGFGRDGTPPSPFVIFCAKQHWYLDFGGAQKRHWKTTKQANSNMCRVCVFGFSPPEIWTLGGPDMQRKTTKHIYTNKWIKCYVVCFSTPEIWIWVVTKKATKNNETETRANVVIVAFVIVPPWYLDLGGHQGLPKRQQQWYVCVSICRWPPKSRF